MKTAIITTIVCMGWFLVQAIADIPWPEHPRPDFKRPAWINLNGTWQFDFDPQDQGLKAEWFTPGRHQFTKQITVPFPWESRLSGIENTEYQGAAWYSRNITMPSGQAYINRDAWLVIGACDWQATVWINGQLAGQHIGGYTPFDINLSQFANPGQQINITIQAVDFTDPQQPTGKQINWYTRTSGIWQTVYIEPRARSYIKSLCAIPNIEMGAVTYKITLNSADPGQKLKLSSTNNAFKSTTIDVPEDSDELEATIEVTDPELWSPDSPTLYPIIFELLDDCRLLDCVESYFGLRQVSVGPAPGRDYQYIYLNGKPIYLLGALHQSFHPDGIHQYPDDATIRKDYELCKKIGLNFLRIHIKAPVPRELYWADKLGILIMQDMPNTWKHTARARRYWQNTFEQVLQRDYNHPAIFAWCLFNETWGLTRDKKKYAPDIQTWVEQMYHLAKYLDPTRLSEENSPCRKDHVITDINSWHFYVNDYKRARDHIKYVVDNTYPGSTFNYIGGRKQGNAPLINSEYGGISAGLGDQDISWCFKYLTNEIRKHDKICGYVYTELSDIEWEHNGFVNYDRSEKEYGYDFWHSGFSLKDLNNPDFIIIDTPPAIDCKFGQAVKIPIKISHWSELKANNLTLHASINLLDRLGNKRSLPLPSQPAIWKSYEVIDQQPYQFTIEHIPDFDVELGVLSFELKNGDKTLARNYVHLLIDNTKPATEIIDAKTIAYRFSPADFVKWTFQGNKPKTEAIAAHKIAGRGPGAVEYQLQLPESIHLKNIKSLTIIAEVAAKAGDEKLDWPARKKKFDYPQTDNKKWPTDVILSLNGVKLANKTLPDDPADSRGVLSHLHGYKGSYGYLVKETAKGTTLKKIIKQIGDDPMLRIRWEVPVDAKNRGGLAIFGEKLGCYPVPPTVLIEFKNEHNLTNTALAK